MGNPLDRVGGSSVLLPSAVATDEVTAEYQQETGVLPRFVGAERRLVGSADVDMSPTIEARRGEAIGLRGSLRRGENRTRGLRIFPRGDAKTGRDAT
jgi:hypothetical protein